jgi:hypothetical protein
LAIKSKSRPVVFANWHIVQNESRSDTALRALKGVATDKHDYSTRDDHPQIARYRETALFKAAV